MSSGLIEEDKVLSPRDATARSMEQDQAVTLGGYRFGVVGSVWCRWRSSAGVNRRHHYRQFSITMVSAMPCRCVEFWILTRSLEPHYKPPEKEHQEKRGFFGWLTAVVSSAASPVRTRRGGVVNHTAVPNRLRRPHRLNGLCSRHHSVPKSFPPDEDQGILVCVAGSITPPGATTERAEEKCGRGDRLVF